MNPGKSGGREKNHNRPLAYRNAPNFDANRKDDKLLVLGKTSEIWPISEGRIKTEGKKTKTNTKHPETMNEPTIQPLPEAPAATNGYVESEEYCTTDEPTTDDINKP